MKYIYKKIISIIISLCLVVGVLSVAVTETSANENDLEATTEEIVENVNGEREDIDDGFNPQPVDRRFLPNTYSLGDEELTSYISPYYTSIKNQNPYGTCWAHAICSVAEANIVKNYEVSEPDFSEWQIAYFIGATYVQDPMGNTNGDSFLIVDETSDYLSVGGNQKIASVRLASWVGVVDEQDASYEIVRKDRQATLDDELAYSKNQYILSGCDYIPYSDRDTVKKAIYENGAVTASYRDSSNCYSTLNYYNTDVPVAEYCPATVSTTTNHAITVIGWDDNYSKENFTGSDMPENDGAWICKNSWGPSFSKDGIFYISYEDGPLSKGNAFSYKYVKADEYDYNYHYDGGAVSSYYGRMGEANIYTATSKQLLKAVGYFTYTSNYGATISIYKNCENNNPVSGELVATLNDTAFCAGYHTVKLDEMIKLNTGDIFSVVIEYTNLLGGSTYVVADVSQEGNWYQNIAEAHEGESYTLNGGKWSVFKTSDGTLLNTRIKALTVDDKSVDDNNEDDENDDDDDIDDNKDILVDSVSLDKQSINIFVGDDKKIVATVLPETATNKSLNWSSTDETVATVDEAGNVVAISAGKATIVCSSTDGSNISASCVVNVEKSKISVSKIALTPATVTMTKGTTKKLNAMVIPADADNKVVSWSSSNDKIVKVNSDGTISAIAPGLVTITCTACDGSGVKASCEVTVNQLISACDIKLSENAFVYTGKPFMPTVTVTSGGTKLVKGVDFTVLYKNNTNVGTAKVVIVGKGYYTGLVNKSFSISPAKTTLSKLLNEKSDIKLTWTVVTGATGYKLYRSDNGGDYKLISSISNGDTVTYKDKAALNNGKLYKYKVVATRGALVSEASDELSIYRVAPVEIVSLKSKSSKAMTIKWKKSTAATKYVIQYSTNSKMTNAKTVTVKGSKNISKTIKKLKKGKKYYVRVKVRKTVGGKNYDSAWSAVKSVKVK